MLINKKITIDLSKTTKKNYYKNLGYDISNRFIEIETKDLNRGSKIIIQAQCDYCFKIRNIIYNFYINSIKTGLFCCSKECSKLKSNNTNLEKYGTKYPTQTNQVKEKTKKTNIERHGVEYPQQSTIISNKRIDNNINKYGVDYPSKLKETKDKVKNTNLEKYEVENYTQSKDFIDKYKNTMMDKYKTLSISKNEEYRKNNFIICKNPFYIKYLENETSLFQCDKGLDHQFTISCDNYHKRLKCNINLCTICNPINSGSISQKELEDYIKSLYNDKIISNYRDVLEIDIYLPELNIGFEYNGLYWHSNEMKEREYHSNKYDYFYNKGISIYSIWEDDWKNKNNIVKGNIKRYLNIIQYSNYIIKDLNIEDCRIFLLENSLYDNIIINYYGIFNNELLIGIILYDNYIYEICKKIDYNFSININKDIIIEKSIYNNKDFYKYTIINNIDTELIKDNIFNYGYFLLSLTS